MKLIFLSGHSGVRSHKTQDFYAQIWIKCDMFYIYSINLHGQNILAFTLFYSFLPKVCIYSLIRQIFICQPVVYMELQEH